MYGIPSAGTKLEPHAVPCTQKLCDVVRPRLLLLIVQRHRGGRPDVNGATHTQNADRGRTKPHNGTDPNTGQNERPDRGPEHTRVGPGTTGRDYTVLTVRTKVR